MKKDILYPLRKLHGDLYEKNEIRKLHAEYKKVFQANPNTVFLVMTPEHNNIGDHAIALTETELLKELGFEYIEISGKKLYEMMWQKRLGAMNGFPIIFNGGGYMGSLWRDGEQMIREVIRSNPKSTIICLPNTIYYNDDEEGRKDFEESEKIYNVHSRLYLYAREKTSYEVMKSAYQNVKLIPDIVLSRDAYQSDAERHGCLVCLRHDHEQTRTDTEEKTVYRLAEELFPGNVADTDMVADSNISADERKKAVISKFKQFSNAELVITDRLHGMIFCAITGTPCIVINSRSPKVRGCYEWIKDLDYIRFADNVTCIKKVYETIPKTTHQYDHSELDSYFNELKNDLRKLIVKK